jgi:hypothetical protein
MRRPSGKDFLFLFFKIIFQIIFQVRCKSPTAKKRIKANTNAWPRTRWALKYQTCRRCTSEVSRSRPQLNSTNFLSPFSGRLLIVFFS